MILAACMMLARILWLVWLCPYELAADEAQYWDWSRRLDLSYYSKGPGIAWTIALFTRLLGDSEWVIRLPAAISTCLAAMALACMVHTALGRGAHAARAALLTVVAHACVPAYHATAILMTIDAPYLACWAIACLSAWILTQRVRAAHSAIAPALALGAALGAGFLFKYTVLLLIPGLAIWAIHLRRIDPGAARRFALAAAPAALIFALLALPVIVWNNEQGWPTLAHLLGHLGARGGDSAPSTSRPAYTPLWTIEFLGGQLALIGPALALMVIACRRAAIERREHAAPWELARFALALAAPILLFYLAVSFVSDAEGNWPIAGYLPLLALVGAVAPREIDRWKNLVETWRSTPDRPRMGFLRRKPETPFQLAWHWSISFGVVAVLGVMSLRLLDQVPVLERVIPLHRISGHRAYAMVVAQRLEEARNATEAEPFIVADQYTRAALLAYYMPSKPSVRSATSYLGGRRSSYDFFDDTSLEDMKLLGRPAMLVGSTPERWRAAFSFDAVMTLEAKAGRRSAVYLGTGYAGPAHPRSANGSP